MTTRYLVKPRTTRYTRATYAIFPIEDCFIEGQPGMLNLEKQLGKVTARTASEAVRLARSKGIGQNCEVWAIECLPDNRLVSVVEVA